MRILLLGLLLVACTPSETLPDCTPGATVACACVGGGSGAQTCSAGRAYGACECPDGGASMDVPGVDVSTDTATQDSSPDVATDSGGVDATDVASDVIGDTNGDTITDTVPVGCVSMTPGNCCGVACPATALFVDHATCVSGRCGVACRPGFGNCDGNPANGCEANLGTSDANCGACGALCAAGRYCGSGCLECPPGFASCDDNGANRCETSLASSAANCGACGHACATDQRCASSRCVCTDPVLTPCSIGCVDVLVNPANCGGCGVACGAGMICRAGSCVTPSCAAGTADCDGMAANGCETNLSTSPANCGACGMACPNLGGTPACRMGRCGTGTCDIARGDCDGNAANGCESDLNTSPTNCGGCGVRCSGMCVMGRCA